MPRIHRGEEKNHENQPIDIIMGRRFIAVLASPPGRRICPRRAWKTPHVRSATVETVKGTVVSVVTSDREFRRMMVKGLHVNLKTDRERLVVFLAPRNI